MSAGRVPVQYAPGRFRMAEPPPLRVPVEYAPGRRRMTAADDLPRPAAAVTRIDTSRLAHSPDGTHFNASLFRFKGRLLLAYRTGTAGSQVHVAELAEDLTPLRSVSLDLRHPRSHGGREDPRLFEHRGRLHVGYIGVQMVEGKWHTNQLYARLSDDLRVEEIFAPELINRQEWEKNWCFFSAMGELFAVYTISPHRIVHLFEGRAHPFCETPAPAWSGGLLRGGASPVWLDSEYWCWFHGRVNAGLLTYTAGVYTFEARPPFRITRISPHPVLWPDRGTVPAGDWKSVVFPCGAVLDGSRWRVSCGVHDRWIEIFEFDHADVERHLVSV